MEARPEYPRTDWHTSGKERQTTIEPPLFQITFAGLLT
jgi:hypothetical protein